MLSVVRPRSAISLCILQRLRVDYLLTVAAGGAGLAFIYLPDTRASMSFDSLSK